MSLQRIRDQGPCIFFYSGLFVQRRCYRSDFGFWWKGRGQEEVRKVKYSVMVSLGTKESALDSPVLRNGDCKWWERDDTKPLYANDDAQQ